MSWTKFSYYWMKLNNAIALAIIGYTSCSPAVQAQTAKPAIPRTTPISQPGSRQQMQRPLLPSLRVKFIPPPPPNLDAPSGRRRGGASRCPDCRNEDLHLTALVPGERSQSFLALTVAEYPTFWFYVPEALTPEQPLEFVLQDVADNYIYKTTLTAPEISAGVVSIPLPRRVAPLEIGKQYHWTFLIHYHPQNLSKYVAVNGQIQRVAASVQLTKQLSTATPQERAALYAANGIWYEALTTLAELRRMHPQDVSLTADWASLLQSVNLNEIATEPIVQCCTPRREKEQ